MTSKTATEWGILYQQLGALALELPEGLGDRACPVTPKMHAWMGRVCVLVAETGSSFDKASVESNCDNLLVGRESSANKIASILYRVVALAESKAPPEMRGAYIAPGETFKAFERISKVLSAARKSALIVDPYLDSKVLTDFAHLASESILIELLADAKDVKTSFSPALANWRNQFRNTRPVDARLAPRGILHDRMIVIDDQDVWVLTQSLNAFATRAPASILKVDADTAALKVTAYRTIWDSASRV